MYIYIHIFIYIYIYIKDITEDLELCLVNDQGILLDLLYLSNELLVAPLQRLCEHRIGKHIGYFEKNSVLSLCQNLDLQLLLTYYWKCYPKRDTPVTEEGTSPALDARTNNPTLSVVLTKNGDIVDNTINEDVQAKVVLILYIICIITVLPSLVLSF
jgi:hypothetical protein